MDSVLFIPPASSFFSIGGLLEKNLEDAEDCSDLKVDEEGRVELEGVLLVYEGGLTTFGCVNERFWVFRDCIFSILIFCKLSKRKTT